MQPNTVQNELFPDVPEADVAAAAARDYVRHISSSITSAEALQQKRKDKGKSVAFDPKKPKRLTIYVASNFPAWQEKYVDLVREAFDATHLSVDEKSLNPKIAKLGEMKKAMPFVQGLKKRLTSGESPSTVFERKLGFDELYVLKEMVPALKKTAGCTAVDLVAVDEGGKTGMTVPVDGDRERQGKKVDKLPPTAEAAVPGNPTFFFQNVDA